jgi:hypothetical protein
MPDLEASIPRRFHEMYVFTNCISVRRHSGYDSKPQTQNSTSLCALILFAAVNRAPFFSGSRIQRARYEPRSPLPGLGFDYRDELVSGVLQLRTERTKFAAITGDGALSANARAPHSPPDRSRHGCGR